MFNLFLLTVVLAASAPDLTKENWDELTAGKTVFVKFYAPWCGHCKAMKPDWDKLMEEFADHPTTLIGDVDCIGDGKELCEENAVEGFPTIKHGDPSDLESYEGGRDFSDIKAFAESLKAVCSVKNIDLCDDDKKAKIAELQGLSDDKLEEMIKAEEDKLEAAGKTFDEAVEKLQETYKKLSEDKEEKTKEIKDSGLGLMKAVKAYFDNRGCDTKTGEACSEKETKYVEKMRQKGGLDAEKTRLEGMVGGKMNPEQLIWVKGRISLLQKMLEETDA
jgi:protein disulfide-isomerase-like protein